MKKFFSFIFLFSFTLFSQVSYKFEKSKVINYSFQLDGRGSLTYPGVKEEKFNVIAKGNLKIETIEFENDVYTIQVIPLKTFVKVGGEILEDKTKSDTEEISSIISSCLIKIKKNGEIISIEEIKKGILTLSQILSLLPKFPDDITTGKKWTQEVPAFELPGIPMCNLKFDYIYEKKEGLSEIKFTANQTIKETKKDVNTKITFTGKNNSKGTFNFNEEEGTIDNFNGNFLLDLNIKYEIPSSPDQKKIETISSKVYLNLNVSFKKLL